MTAFYYTCSVTWLGGLIADLKVASCWETMKNQLQWSEPPKEGNEFSWLQVGGSKRGAEGGGGTETGRSQFFLKKWCREVTLGETVIFNYYTNFGGGRVQERYQFNLWKFNCSGDKSLCVAWLLMWNFLYWFGASDWHFLAGCNSQNCQMVDQHALILTCS